MVISIICKTPLNLDINDYEYISKKFGMGVVVIDEHHLVLKTDDAIKITEDTNIISESVQNIWDYVEYMSQMVA
jgi:hypothetical protein